MFFIRANGGWGPLKIKKRLTKMSNGNSHPEKEKYGSCLRRIRSCRKWILPPPLFFEVS